MVLAAQMDGVVHSIGRVLGFHGGGGGGALSTKWVQWHKGICMSAAAIKVRERKEGVLR